MTETTKPTGLALLREPFPAHQISKLPKPLKKDGQKGKCQECGGYHVLPAVHLDYVGHAALTDRLLDADPSWQWEPLAVDNGLPVMDGMGGMWIKLTVCGVTRLGYGHAGEKRGGDAIKEVIGDALRNAAMRFGAALDLWHKGDLHLEEPEEQPAPKGQLAQAGRIKATDGAETLLSQDRRLAMDDMAAYLIEAFESKDELGAIAAFYNVDNYEHEEEKVYLWKSLGAHSKLRALLKANRPEPVPA